MSTNRDTYVPLMGYTWRSSKAFVLVTIAIALYAETFLYGFLVPVLGEMLEHRLHVPPSKTQGVTSSVLSIHGALGVISGPLIGHLSDRFPKRKVPLLLSLGVCIVGTYTVAAAPSVPILLLGRVLQSVAGSAVWIIGFATVADTVSPNNMGSAMGLIMSFANAGTITGPAIAGLLYEVVDYWVLWSVPLLVLAIDLVARLLMIDHPSRIPIPSSKSNSRPSEATRLLPSSGDQGTSSGIKSFWCSLLCNGRILICLLITFSSVTVSTSLYATLPLHIQNRFEWGPSYAGLLFAGLAVPGIFIGPFAGWVRDRVGARYPVTVGAVLQALFLALNGFAGTDILSWCGAQTHGKEMYAASLIAIGILRPFVSGIAPAELTSAAKRIQERNTVSSGGEDGVSRMIAMMDVAASLGMMIGPIAGGLLNAQLDYKYMTLTLGE
ncbi:Major facilitator superfamily domain general substrate transporter [Penicillium herquei]|nr:Major facilitator superfamily domain general substrate transporter [Penicillium herquei]